MGTISQRDGLRLTLGRINSPAALTGALHRVVELLTIETGFSMAAASLVQPGGSCQTLAVAAPPSLQAALTDTCFATQAFVAEIANAEQWGVLQLVSPEHSCGASLMHPAGAGAREGLTAMAGVLYAPLNDDEGTLLGVLAVGLTVDQPRPGIAAQKLLADVAAEVATSIEALTAFTRWAPGIDPDLARTPAAGAGTHPPQQPSAPPETQRAGSSEARPPSRTHLPTAARNAELDPYLQDPETGLPNLQGLASTLSVTLQRLKQDGTTAAVLVCVLEEFDTIAQSFGPEVAEQVLLRVSQRMREGARSYDVVGRVSHNTMAVIADRIAPQDTRSLATRLRHTLAKVHMVDDRVIRVRGTFGVALVDEQTDDEKKMFDQAKADSEARRAGQHGTYILYSRYSTPRVALPR